MHSFEMTIIIHGKKHLMYFCILWILTCIANLDEFIASFCAFQSTEYNPSTLSFFHALNSHTNVLS